MLSKEDRRAIGELTADDLREGLRVNRALREQAECDVKDLARREDRVRLKMLALDRELAAYREAAASAPERIARLDRRIADQEAGLAELGAKRQREAEGPKAAKARRVEEILAELSRGITTHVDELTRLVG